MYIYIYIHTYIHTYTHGGLLKWGYSQIIQVTYDHDSVLTPLVTSGSFPGIVASGSVSQLPDCSPKMFRNLQLIVNYKMIMTYNYVLMFITH